MISRVIFLMMMVFGASIATNTTTDTDLMGALDPHSFAEGDQPSNSNHGNLRVLMIVDNDYSNGTGKYDGVSLADSWDDRIEPTIVENTGKYDAVSVVDSLNQNHLHLRG